MRPNFSSYSRFASASAVKRFVRRRGGAALLLRRPAGRFSSRRCADARRTLRASRCRSSDDQISSADRERVGQRARGHHPPHPLGRSAAGAQLRLVDASVLIRCVTISRAALGRHAVDAHPRDAAVGIDVQPHVRGRPVRELVDEECRVSARSFVRGRISLHRLAVARRIDRAGVGVVAFEVRRVELDRAARAPRMRA